MRQIIKDFISLCAQNLELTPPIYEFGSLQVPGQEGFADLRPLFPGAKYIGCDLQSGPGVDKIIDLHQIELPSTSVNTALCLDTFEHVEYPRKAIAEIHRILSPGGILILTSVMRFIIHEYPFDYWRFTPEGFSSLCQIFPYAYVMPIGDPRFPHTIIAIAWKMAPHITTINIIDRAFMEFQKSCPA